MRMFLVLVALAAGSSVASAQSGGWGTGSNPNNHYVQGHFNSNGTYTSGHHQTNPNQTQYDNYGTRGNVNPYTGAVGTRIPRY
jgi:hypothetical protein